MWPILAGALGALAAGLLWRAWAGERRLRHNVAQLEALDAATLSITGDLMTETVLQKLAAAARTLAGADYCALGVLPEEGGPAHFVTSGLPDGAEESMNCLSDLTGVRGLVLRTGRPLRVADVRAHLAFAGFPAGHLPVRALLGVPILSHGRTLGAIYLARERAFSAADEAQAARLARHAAAAVVSARLYQETNRARSREEARQRRLALLEVRDRISMDLHDGTIQQLYAIGLGLGALRRQLPADGPGKELAGATAELNRVIADLRAYILDQGTPRWTGLTAGLEAQAATIPNCEVRVELAIEAEPPPEVADQLVRVAGEALANARRHSGAHLVVVSGQATAAAVALTVTDDGCGFDVAAASAKGRLGLRNMQARARALGGECRIESAPGRGTAVAVQVPLEGEAVSWGNSPFA